MFERREQLISLARKFAPGGAIVAPVAKRAIAIDALLRWAYREELPKAAPIERRGPEGFGPSAANLGFCGSGDTGIYLVNRFGVSADQFATSEPHPDSMLVAAAVAALDRFELCLPPDWDPFGDLGDMGGHRAASVAAVIERLCVRDIEGEWRLRNPVGELMLRCAILGPPDWRADVPQALHVCGANGKQKWFVRRLIETDAGAFEIEADGMSVSKKRPVDGAYRKTYLDPDPFEAGLARGEYEIWHSALGWLAADLAGRLDSFEIARCGLPARPWEDAARGIRARMVLRDLSR